MEHQRGLRGTNARRQDLATGGASVETGARLLRIVSAAAAIAWIVAVASVFWTSWDAFGDMDGGPFGGDGGMRLVRSVAGGLAQTWGYALVAVLAYSASTLLVGLRAVAEPQEAPGG